MVFIKKKRKAKAEGLVFVMQGVYDISLGTDEVDRLKPWLANIHARAPGCPVIIVGTHYDKMAPGRFCVCVFFVINY